MCSIDGCGGKVVGRGWCAKHWARWRRHGDPLHTKVIRGDDEARFWSKVDKDGPVPEHRPELGPCWLWTGYLDRDGYGPLRTPTGHVRSHRFAYELLIGPIPDCLVLDHLCRVRQCVNPAHLEPVTNGENVLRGDTFVAANARKTTCPQGHPYDATNSQGRRVCSRCQRTSIAA